MKNQRPSHPSPPTRAHPSRAKASSPVREKQGEKAKRRATKGFKQRKKANKRIRETMSLRFHIQRARFLQTGGYHAQRVFRTVSRTLKPAPAGTTRGTKCARTPSITPLPPSISDLPPARTRNRASLYADGEKPKQQRLQPTRRSDASSRYSIWAKNRESEANGRGESAKPEDPRTGAKM